MPPWLLRPEIVRCADLPHAANDERQRKQETKDRA
jgi:hypothetical protein